MTASLLDSFARSKRAAGCVPNTVDSYLIDARLLVAHLERSGAELATATRRDVEQFMSDQVDAGKAPATLAHRYRSFVQLFRWLAEEDELHGPNPMAKMRSPIVPETPPPVVTPDVFARLIAASSKAHRNSTERIVFETRRDPALLRMLWSSGIRAGEIMGCASTDSRRPAILSTSCLTSAGTRGGSIPAAASRMLASTSSTSAMRPMIDTSGSGPVAFSTSTHLVLPTLVRG